MKVLFVSSGNSKSFEISPFIIAQGNSLSKVGIEISYFSINDNGLLGYLKAVLKLRRYLKEYPVDIIHAHYTLSGWSSVIAFPKQPIVLSLMGTDANGKYTRVNKIKFSSRYLIFFTYLIQPFVKSIICKSKNIESVVYLKNKSSVTPNGILLEQFRLYQHDFKDELRLNRNKKHLLFLGNKTNETKNYKLIEDAVKLINRDDISLIAPYPVSHDDVVKYLNSAEVLVVPSLMEGSPNVVKEAMACNVPVVATDVGDVAWLFGEEPGHFLISFDPKDAAAKILSALNFAEKAGRTNGRQRLISLGLDSETVAKKIINVYHEVTKNVR